MKLNIFIEQLKTIEETLIKNEYRLKDYEVVIDYWTSSEFPEVNTVKVNHNRKQIIIGNISDNQKLKL